MGCGGSKEDVATGNTMSSRSLLRKKSDATSSKTSSSSTSTTQDAGVDSIDTGSKLVPDEAQMGNVSNHSPSVGEVEGVAPSGVGGDVTVVVSKGSPDLYASKDKEAVVAVATRRVGSDGAEYFSPRSEIEGGKNEAEDGLERSIESGGLVAAAAKDGEGQASKVENSLVSEGGEEIGPKGEEGRRKGEDSADLKEAIMVEERESGATEVEKKNVGGEGEIGNNPLSQ